MATTEDRLIHPTMVAVQQCAVAQLAIAGRPVCYAHQYFADHMLPAANCDCICITPEGGQGVTWVRMISAQTTESTTRMAPCPSGEMSWQLELGVWRCAPSDDQGLDEWTKDMMGDLASLRRAFVCCDWLAERDIRPAIQAMNPVGPSGGCVGAVVRATLTGIACDCPDTAAP